MLRKKTFQNKVAPSRYALPFTATLATLVWVAVGFIEGNIWLNFAFTIISTLLMVELNNHNSLMRTYSRMVSCSFLVRAFISQTFPAVRVDMIHHETDILLRIGSKVSSFRKKTAYKFMVAFRRAFLVGRAWITIKNAGAQISLPVVFDCSRI